MRCEPSQIQQALTNLCLNAVDAMSAGGDLHLAWRRGDGAEAGKFGADASKTYVCFSIRDTGEGMDSETLASIFEPFYTKKPVGKGTGLGLYVVYGIAKSHDGWVSVDSEPGRGTRVTLGIPEEVSPAESGPVTERDAPPRKRDRASPPHILVVDDEVGLLGLLTEVLESESYRVTTARDGEEALKVFAANRSDLDLMITDIGMPNMGGHELIRKVRELDRDFPIVVASGYMDPSQLAALEGTDILAVLAKPFEVRDVVDTLAGILG